MDASIQELARVIMGDDDEALTHDAPSGSDTTFTCGSNDVELEANDDLDLDCFND